MKTSMILDDDVLAEAQQLTKIQNKTDLVHRGLRALISQESARRLALMGGSDKKASAPPRRRS